MITLENLAKTYGEKRAVDDLSVTIRSGRVTGFLGPNGAGKSTTMRLILGLDRPTRGEAYIDGRRYAELSEPLRHVGALLDPRTGHPGQSASSHLLGMARSNGIGRGRVDTVIETVGLATAAHKRIGTFSLGMRQRLGIASALLGDPDTLMFDEPVNGLDPDGVRWIRSLMRSLAAEGRTVFVSSHLLSEMQETADHLIVIGKGKLIVDDAVGAVIGASSLNSVTVRGPEMSRLGTALERIGKTVARGGDGAIHVTGSSLSDVGAIAFAEHIQIDELAHNSPSLEKAYAELTGESLEYDAAELPSRQLTLETSE